MIKYEEAISILMEKIPEFREQYREWDMVESNLPQVVFDTGGGFAAFVTDLVSKSVRDDLLIERCFLLIEDLLTDGDAATVDVVLTFLGGLGDWSTYDDDFIRLVKSYMKPETRNRYETSFPQHAAWPKRARPEA